MSFLTFPDVTSFPDFADHKKIVEINDPQSGLIGFIAVHSTSLGPSLGGCRVYPYASREAAITDVLRLSRGMTYKSALAGLPLGGGKAVIIADPRSQKTPELMQAFGRAIDALKGTYITAEDVGSTENDMVEIGKFTQYVSGLPHHKGVGGNPSPYTAYGIFCGMRAAVRHRLGTDDFSGITVAVQGLGAVGYALAKKLHTHGANIIACDVNSDRLDMAKAEMNGLRQVSLDEIYEVACDVFAPCAMGAVINDKTIQKLKAKIIAGGANNQLADNLKHDEMLKDRHILYAPDYALNSGGVTLVGYEYFQSSGYNPFAHPLTQETVMAHIENIDQTMIRIFTIAEKEGCTTGKAADRLAEKIFKRSENNNDV